MEDIQQSTVTPETQRPSAEIMMAVDADSWFARRVGHLAQLAAAHEGSPETVRRAVPPNLIPVRMSAENQQWLMDRQEEARQHRLDSAADAARRGQQTRAR